MSERIKLEKHQIDHELRLTMESVARDIAQRLSGAIPDRQVVFALFMFEVGEGGVASYISNMQRADMNAALTEFLEESRKGGQNEVVGPLT